MKPLPNPIDHVAGIVGASATRADADHAPPHFDDPDLSPIVRSGETLTDAQKRIDRARARLRQAAGSDPAARSDSREQRIGAAERLELDR